MNKFLLLALPIFLFTVSVSSAGALADFQRTVFINSTGSAGDISNLPFIANGTFGLINLQGQCVSPRYAWVLNSPIASTNTTNGTILYSSCSSFSFNNFTGDPIPFEEENGTNSLTPTSVWSPLNYSIVAHFGEGFGTTTADSTSFGNTGTLTGAGIVWNTTKPLFGNFITHQGSADQYVDFGDTASIAKGNTFTASIWFRPNRNDGVSYQALFDKGTNTGTDQFYVRINPTNKVEFAIAGTTVATSTDSVNFGQWNFVVFTYDGTSGYGWLNGKFVGASAKAMPIVTTHLKVGGDTTASGQGVFLGDIDEFRLTSTNMTDAQIKQMWGEGNSLLSYLGPESQSSTSIQTFTAKDLTSQALINNWNFRATNGSSTTQVYSTTNGTIKVNISSLPFGNVMFTANASGYVTNVTNFTINSNDNATSRTFFLSVSKFTLQNVYDIRTLNPICYNFTLANGSSTFSNGGCGTFSINTSLIPVGDSVTLAVSNATYWTANYLLKIQPYLSTNISAYLSAQSQGYVVRFHMVNSFGVPVTGGIGYAYTNINGVTTLVSQSNADGSGTVSIFMDPILTYSLTFTASGYNNASTTIQPTSQDYTVTMGQQGGNITGQVGNQFLWSVINSGGLYGNSTLIPINFTYVDYASLTSQWGLNISYNGSLISTNSFTTQQGSVIIYVNTANRVGTVIATAWAVRSVQGLINQTYFYTVYSTNPTDFLSFGNFPTFGTVAQATNASGLTHPFTDFVALFIILIAMGAFSKLPWHITGAGIMGLILLGGFIYIGWVSFTNNPAIAGPTYADWGIYLALWIVVIMVAFLKQRL